jgi:hypothetical protein
MKSEKRSYVQPCECGCAGHPELHRDTPNQREVRLVAENERLKADLLKWADRIYRDRREPDKILAYSQSMRSEALT